MSVDLNPQLFTELALALEQDPISGFPEHFYILDCETTGGRPTRDRMTELAWIEIRSGRIAGYHNQLFDPDIAIPPWIQKLTGISNRMVEEKPYFSQCADFLFESLNQQVIMAHNARFDYGFLKNEFRRSGYSFSAKTFCSVKLSRTLYPQSRRHNLDSIIQRCQIQLQSRHRAMTDVLAILAFLRKISLEQDIEYLNDVCSSFLKKPSLPSHLDSQQIEKLPHRAGIYYFYDADDHLLYIGKSVDLRTRVMSHFVQDHQSATDAKLSRNIHHIDFCETATDFGAQLLEAREIKRLSPSYNQRLRRNSGLYQIRLQTTAEGFYVPEIRAVKENAESLASYGLYKSRRQAKNVLRKLARDLSLCQQLLGLESPSENACFAFQLNQCKGACCGLETSDAHNARFIAALESKKHHDWPWPGPILVEEQHQQHDEEGVTHLVYQWCYFGPVDNDQDLMEMLEQPLPDFDLDIYHILIRFLFNHSPRQHHLVIKPLTLDNNTVQDVA